MSSEIRVLSDETINKVAAGEVVERPASALKELVENSLDAGSGSIDILIEGSGKKTLRVTDDGEGMSHDGIILALERHSKSKIADAADLERIESFGFRGEALPSIAAVSRMRIVSRLRGADAGTRVDIVSGKISNVSPCGAPAGTSIEVRNLFRNVPARLKFLRTNATESSHCVHTVSQLALANPGTAFSLKSGSRHVLHLKGAEGAGERLRDCHGPDFFETLLPIRFEEGSLSVRGFIARPGTGRRGSDFQSLFVNRRPVRDHILTKVVREVWRDYSLGGDPATFFIWITLPPDHIDVNVHPTKREVRFRNVSALSLGLAKALRGSLGRSRVGFRTPPPAQETAEDQPSYRPCEGEPLELPVPASPSPVAVDRAPLPMLQLFSTYIVMTDDEGLLLIDQHAAHERVMYEKMLEAFDRGAAQQLLHPVVIDLTAAQGEILGELAEALSGYGISVELFGNRSFRISALPVGLTEGAAESFILQLLDGLRKDALPTERPGWLRERAARAACHASVRASQKISPTQVQALLRDLFACANPGHCPHGRPTHIRLDRREIEKRFRRIP